MSDDIAHYSNLLYSQIILAIQLKIIQIVPQIINNLCIDVDDISYAYSEAGYSLCSLKFVSDYETEQLLLALDDMSIKATFFIPGHTARIAPNLVRKIANGGHEIASHGTKHCAVSKLGKVGFYEDIIYSKSLLEDLTGQIVDTYKAPAWTLNRNTPWAYDQLIKAGFTVDHSCQPWFKRHIGIPADQLKPFVYQNALLVIPPTIIKLGPLILPIAGGLWTAMLPLSFLIRYYSRLNKRNISFNFYLHPYEFKAAENNRKLYKYGSLPTSILTLHTGVYKNKLSKLCSKFKICPLRELVRQLGWGENKESGF